MIRRLRDDKLLETAEQLGHRIGTTFPGSGLSEVSDEVVSLIREAVVVADRIRRPNLWLRGGLILLPIVLLLVLWLTFRGEEQVTLWGRIIGAMTATQGSAVYLTAAFVFLFTLEVRLKRWQAIKAVHELRAMAHLIDMHQLAKDPVLLGITTRGCEKPLSPEAMGRYLHYCTELLALVSKVAHLYVQGFADVGAQTAVDGCESLATGLSQKIWQKLMILDRIRSDAEDEPEAKVTSVTAAPAPAAHLA